MEYRTLEDIRRDYNNGAYVCHMIIPERVSDSHVFDENLSVKKNREMAKERNQKVTELTKERMMRNNELFLQMRNDVVKYIAATYNMTEEQARFVEEYVYVEKHSFMCDYFGSIDEICEMVERVLGTLEG